VAEETSFPQGFLWGASTAAYQVEGAVREGGRGVSIWDKFSHTPGRTKNGDTGDVACRHYERLEEDLDLMGDLGLRAYRFSVAWPRVQPEGKGPANQAGLDFYRRLTDGLRQRGVVPMATLYHWDLPQPLEDAGGWPVRDTAERFADYVEMVAAALGDQVGLWVTLNEPWCSAWLGYGNGVHAPGRKNLQLSLRATHNLLVAHALGAQVLRRDTQAPVGIALNLAPQIPASAHELDVEAARRADGGLNRMYLGPLFKGAYPEDVLELASVAGLSVDNVQDGDMALVSAPVDFLGVNYYMTWTVASTARLAEARQAGYVAPDSLLAGDTAKTLGFTSVGRPWAERTAAGWEVDPAGLTALLVRLRNEYTRAPVYVTENGAAFYDYRGPDGAVHDPERVSYLQEHVKAVGEALREGVDVRGYFVWSLLDNFEWSQGYSLRFGLTWVDYPSSERVKKDSFAWYRDVIAANGLP
jgi:beta-glucosidase